LAGAHVQLVTGVGDVEIGGPFADAQDASDLPAGLALCRPVQVVVFPLGQQLHVTRPPVGSIYALMKAIVSKCIIVIPFVE
jgi:hypothetical protein